MSEGNSVKEKVFYLMGFKNKSVHPVVQLPDINTLF